MPIGCVTFVCTLSGVGNHVLQQNRAAADKLKDVSVDGSACLTVSTVVNGKPAEVVIQRNGRVFNVVVTRGAMRNESQVPLF